MTINDSGHSSPPIDDITQLKVDERGDYQGREGYYGTFARIRQLPILTPQSDHIYIARQLEQAHNFATMKDTGEMYVYQDGVYQAGGEALIQQEARSMLDNFFSTHKVKEIENSIRYSTHVDRNQFDADKLVLNLNNGLLNMTTKGLFLHSPDYLSLVRIPVAYHADAKCPRINQFLHEVLREEDITLVQEIFGYCLLREYKIHKAFMLQGSGRNGKSTLLNLLQCFLGKRNCSNVDLASLCSDRFASSQLFGKLANIFSDLPTQALKNVGIFKALVGGDRINAQEKFKKPFEFTNYAKLIFSCNYVPMSYDLSPAFFARWIIIRFPNSFEGSEANTNLLEELTTEEELSGLLNLALTGLERLKRNGRFSYDRNPDEIADEYQRLSNPVSAFISDCIEEAPEEYVVKEQLYNAFKVYCKQNGYPVFSEKRFTEWLKKELPILEYRPSIDGQQKRAWQGINLLPAFSSPSIPLTPSSASENPQESVYP